VTASAGGCDDDQRGESKRPKDDYYIARAYARAREGEPNNRVIAPAEQVTDRSPADDKGGRVLDAWARRLDRSPAVVA
jgi:hypothetical protein